MESLKQCLGGVGQCMDLLRTGRQLAAGDSNLRVQRQFLLWTWHARDWLPVTPKVFRNLQDCTQQCFRIMWCQSSNWHGPHARPAPSLLYYLPSPLILFIKCTRYVTILTARNSLRRSSMLPLWIVNKAAAIWLMALAKQCMLLQWPGKVKIRLVITKYEIKE